MTDFNEPWQEQLEPWVIANDVAQVDVFSPRPPNRVGSSGDLVNSTRLYFQPYPLTASARNPGSRPNAPVFDVAMSEENRIECVGELPFFPLPDDFSSSDFDDVQALCAVQSFGGKK